MSHIRSGVLLSVSFLLFLASSSQALAYYDWCGVKAELGTVTPLSDGKYTVVIKSYRIVGQKKEYDSRFVIERFGAGANTEPSLHNTLMRANNELRILVDRGFCKHGTELSLSKLKYFNVSQSFIDKLR